MIETFDTNQILFFLLIMSITALFAGFFAGFFGIGGGIITVPCLFYIFGSVGIDKSFIMHLAVGTSFAIMIPTAIMSVYTHYKHKAVDFDILKSYGIFVVTGVIIGSLIAAYLNTQFLVLFFSLALYLLAINLFFLKDKTKLKLSFNLFQRTTLGFVVGFVSSLMGIGGAIMNVPILKFVGYTINKAIDHTIYPLHTHRQPPTLHPTPLPTTQSTILTTTLQQTTNHSRDCPRWQWCSH